MPQQTAASFLSSNFARWSIALEAPVFNGFFLPYLDPAGEMLPREQKIASAAESDIAWYVR